MLARAVEAEALGSLYVGAESVVGGRGQQPPRPVALVQHHRQVGGLPVQEHAPVPQLDAAQPGIRPDLVHDLIATQQTDA